MSSSRRAYHGNVGQELQVYTNSFVVTSLPSNDFYHYDVEFDVKLDRRRKLEIVDKMQVQYPQLFTPRAAYDGEKNMFRSQPLTLSNNSATLTVYRGNPKSPHAKGVNVTIKQVARINPSCLRDVLQGRSRSMQSEGLTSLSLLNVLIRMKPILTYPSNARSFFTSANRSESIGQGLELWRGYFQSVKVSIDHLLINVDISTAVMYRGGQLLDVVKLFLNLRNVNDLNINRMSQPIVRTLTRFLKGLLVYSIVPRPPSGATPKTRPIKEIVLKGADDYQFDKDDEAMTITQYFRRTYNYHVNLGKVICIGFGKGIVYPIEVLEVKEGQFYKKRLSPAATSAVLTFSTQKPHKRLEEIQRAAPILGYHDSDFLAHAGFTVDTRQALLIKGRILPSLSLTYKNSTAVPNGGGWNVLRQKLLDPKSIRAWGFIVFARIDLGNVRQFAYDFRKACNELGMGFPGNEPPVIDGNPQGDIAKQLTSAGGTISSAYGGAKPLLFIVVPDSAADIIAAAKHWGDCVVGCPTQCVKASKIMRANNQYHNNVALKVNIRMGGMNWAPAAEAAAMQWFLKEPTMVVGVDVGHAGAGSNKPSVSGLVSSVDHQVSRYVAFTAVQESRQELITDLDWMMDSALTMFNDYQNAQKLNIYPKRILFYRDGLSEGQFEGIAGEEIKVLRGVLKKKGISAELVYIVVGKRHHVRFFPQDSRQGDRSGNCPAGLVVDQGIVHPIDRDFYLQSHGGLLGTSRSAHYTIIQDDVNMSPNDIQNVSYALCHVYGRATRSVSIPAPVYYADLVCRRGKFHSTLLRDTDDGSIVSSESESLQNHIANFKPVHGSMSRTMYWI